MKLFGPFHLLILLVIAVVVGVLVGGCEPEDRPVRQCSTTRPCPPTVVR